MSPRSFPLGLGLICSALLLATPTAATQTWQGVPAPSVQLRRFADAPFLAASPTGATACGRIDQGFLSGVAQRWLGGGLTVQELAGSSEATAISDDGHFLLGTRPWNIDPQWFVAARWSPIEGWTSLPQPQGVPPIVADLAFSGHAMSGDGQTIVGGWGQVTDPDWRAYRWTSSGGSELLSMPLLGNRSTAYAVSDDGQVIGGTLGTLNLLTLEQRFEPCLWHADGTRESLLPATVGSLSYPSDSRSAVVALDADGDAALLVDDQGLPLLWRDGKGLLSLPASADGSIQPEDMRLLALGDDGAFVLGDAFGTDGWLWTLQTGTLPMADVLESLGLLDELDDVTSWGFLDGSADGTRLVGAASTMNGFFDTDFEGLVLDMPAPASFGEWDDLGGSLGAPGLDAPVLTGQGLLTPGSTGSLRVTYAEPGSLFLVTGLAELSAPFKGGTLVPTPDLITSLPFPGGELVMPFGWPDLPAGTELHWQSWHPTASAPFGFVASNGLRTTTN